jgi:imidazolonepropionase-like amidohydrolase
VSTRLALLVLAVLLAAAPATAEQREPYESTYVPRPAEDLLIKGAVVLTGAGARLDGVDVHLSGGRIAAIGPDLPVESARVIDASGRWLTPGIIDVHSHLGDYPAPDVPSLADGNEVTSPNTSQVWAEHSVWPQDPQFPLALAGGVTTLQILPGSANLFGGRGVTLKNVPSRTVQGMKFPGAKQSLKMACGENPKRVYGSQKQAPSTRMGNVAGYRAAWAKAQHALEVRDIRAAKLAARAAGGEPAAAGNAAGNDGADLSVPPERDLGVETLIGVLEGEILVHNHCYRADEMAWMIDVAREFGYRISTFHHAVESYKIADLLAEEGICSAMWSEQWGFKLEAFDAIPENVALVDAAGACAIVHSDSPIGIQRLNQEAAKAMAAARRRGMAVDEARAITWITLNAARALEIDDETGSIEVGKAADVVLWSGNPFSVYTRADQVYIDGHRYYDRLDGIRPVTDFELDQTVTGGAP